MLAHLLRRLLLVGATVVVVAFLTYAGMTCAPGDAVDSLLGDSATAEQAALLRRQMRLDLPVWQGFLEYASGALREGDLGNSLSSGRPVATEISDRLAPSAELALVAILLALLAGLPLGFAAAARAGGPLDLLLSGFFAIGLAIPSYWVAILLVQLVAVRLGWLPVMGAGSLAHLILPAVTLALPTTAVIARLMRASAIEVLSTEYVRTARAKGLGQRKVMFQHVLPNAVMPALSLLGLYLARLIGGAFVVETIFAWPGLGRLVVESIAHRDIPLIVGSVLVVAPLSLSAILFTDILQAVLDPRVRREAL